MIAGLVWQRIGRRGAQVRLLHVGWFALVLGIMLPAHLATRFDASLQYAPWMIPVAAGWTLVMLMWTLGGVGAGRVSPILVGYLLLCVMYGNAFVANRVLQRDHLVTGNLMASVPDTLRGTGEPWIWAERATGGPGDALFRESSAKLLSNFTTGTEAADPRLWLSLDVLLRDRLPPLEDFILGGEPGPIGAGCALGVIVGGLFLLYRGLIDYRIPC
jgi:Na+-translocating ferredoxin:NAD+ oxidoreductase RnfD subunit